MMKRVDLGPIELSRIAYGMWRLAEDADTSPAHVQAKVEACLDQGITTMDQAAIYGGFTAERVLGDAFRAAPSLRDRCEIVTKFGIVIDAGRHGGTRVKHYDTTRPFIEASVEASLKEMGIEAIDLLLVHRPDPMMDPDETGAALDALVTSGKVRAVGVSNFRPWDTALLASAMESPLVANQIELSLGAPEALTDGDLADIQLRQMACMAWSPLGGGALMTGPSEALAAALDRHAEGSGTDRAAVATAWLLAHPARVIPVMGTNSLERIARLSDALKVHLDRQDWYELYQAALGREVA